MKIEIPDRLIERSKFAMSRKFQALLLGLLMSFSVMAQERAVTGTVVGTDGLGIPGVNVAVKGTTNGTITNVDGVYKLNANDGEVLLYSFIGYIQQEVVVGNQANYDIILQEDVTDLDEVVVTALGIKREKKSLGYSVTEVDSEEMTTTREINAINSLSGKVAGVQINQPTSGPTGSTRVVIRGISELDGDNQPLYVIDGVPMDNTNFGQADSEGGYDMASGISDLNPDDIESLSVLKGASASALYGTRALNGVILITTKKGTSQKGIGVEINSNFTFDQLKTGYEDVQYEFGMGSAGQIPDTQERAATWSTMWGARLGKGDMVTIHDGSQKPYVAHKDNIQDFFRTGYSNTNTVNLSGGDEKSTFRLGVSDLRANDIIPETSLSRTTITFRGSTQLSEKLSVDAKVSYITDKVENRPQLSNAGIGANLLYLPNNYDQAWLKNHSDENGVYYKWTNYIGRENPYWVLDNVENQSRKKRIIGFADVSYKITDKLSFKVKAGTDFYSNKFYEVASKSDVLQNRPGRMYERNIDVSEENFEGLLSYNNTFGDFSVSANIGANKMKYQYRERYLIGSGIITDGVKALDNYNDKQIFPYLSRKIINSVYAFGQVGYKGYLFLDLTHRTDWSSSLPSGNNQFSYPSISSSFVFSDAFELPEVITFGKIRASWAKVGGDTDAFRLDLNYRGREAFNGESTASIEGDMIPNKDLKPEETTSYEIGTDMRFFGNRLGFDVTYYSKNTVNQILRLPVSRTTGYNEAVINAGEISNKGIELLVTGTPIRTNDFEWNLSFNFTKNKNEVKKLHDQISVYEIENARWAGATIAAIEGEQFGSIMGNEFLRAPDGQIIHDEEGYPVMTTEKQILGNFNPDWMGGVNSDFSYKGVSLKMAFDIRMGGELYSMTNLRLYETGLHKGTLPGRDEYNEWSAQRRDWVENNPSGDVGDWDADNPRQGYVGEGVVNVGTEENPVYETNTTQVAPSAYWGTYTGSPEPFVYDASFVKLRSLSIGYTLPESLLRNTPLAKVTVSAIGTNLWTLYKNVPNIDPESAYNTGNGQGLEYGSFPGRSSYGFNINVKF